MCAVVGKLTHLRSEGGRSTCRAFQYNEVAGILSGRVIVSSALLYVTGVITGT